MIRLAIFSDIHGKLLLPFKLCDLYQKETGNKIDLIVQCGDIGAFPNLENIDKATLKHAEYDRDELGFHDDFTIENESIANFLEELDLEMVCVRGNHEDHEYLDDLENEYPQQSSFPIDTYRRVWVCKTGEEQQFKKKGETITFVGIGRIGDRKGREQGRFIQGYERKKIANLLKSGDIYDLLITHDKDDSSQRGYGMSEIREVLDNIPFQYHFYGHTGEPFNMVKDSNGITQSCKIKELEFNTQGILPEGCMVILEKTKDGKFNMEVVPRSLTNKLTKHGWKYAIG